jgi:hypothetical protein
MFNHLQGHLLLSRKPTSPPNVTYIISIQIKVVMLPEFEIGQNGSTNELP